MSPGAVGEGDKRWDCSVHPWGEEPAASLASAGAWQGAGAAPAKGEAALGGFPQPAVTAERSDTRPAPLSAPQLSPLSP